MNVLVNRLVSAGIQPGDDEVRRRKVRFFNGVILVSMSVLVVLAATEAIERSYWALPLHVGRFAGFFLAYYVLSRGKYFASLYIVQYTILLSSVAGTIVAPETNSFHFLIIPACAISFYLAGGKMENVIFFVLNVLYFVVAYFYNLCYLPREILVSNVVSILVIFAAFYVTLAVYVWEYRRYERVIGQKNDQLVAQNDLLEQQNHKLELQNRQLEGSNAMKNGLFTIISHDLKGPFNNIAGFTELLNKGFRTSSEQKNEYYLELLRESVSQTSFVLDDFLYWAKCQADNVEVEKEKISIQQLLDDLQQIFKSFIIAKNISVEYEVIEQMDRRVDRTLLAIVLRNLFSNAIKSTPQNGIIALSACHASGKYVISIKDSGFGISVDVLNSLGRSSTCGTGNELGYGIGLITCFELAKKLDARVKFARLESGGVLASVTFN